MITLKGEPFYYLKILNKVRHRMKQNQKILLNFIFRII